MRAFSFSIKFATEKINIFGLDTRNILLSMNKKTTIVAAISGKFTNWFYLGVFACCLILLPADLSAQEQPDAAKPQILVDLAQTDGQGGQIELVQPVQVENLLKMQIANNKLQKGIPGYRIRIFSQSGQTARQKANDTRSAFMKSFPETEAYLEYNTPNFQILVGDYRTKNEALRQYKQITKMFPNAFIVSEMINIPL